MQKHFKIATLLIGLLSSQPTWAQVGAASTTKKMGLGNTQLGSKEQEYTLAGINVTGIKYLDEELLIAVTALTIGDKVKLENDEKFTKAILNLWKQKLFSYVSIDVEKIIDNKMFVVITLTERPRLSKYNFKGIKQSEANDIKEKIGLVKNTIITDALKMNATANIKKVFYEKGYLNTTVSITDKVDTSFINMQMLTFTIDKGTKTKINEVAIEGNQHANLLKVKSKMKGSKEMARLSLHPVIPFSKDEYKAENKAYWQNKGYFSISKTLEHFDPYLRYKFITASKFNKKKFAEDKDNIVDYYNSLGYRDAFIESDKVTVAPNGNLNLDVKVNEGQKYHIGNITWRGNTKYSDSILTQILGIKKGDDYNQALLDRRLGKTPSQDGDDITSLYMDDGYLYFSIDAQEASIDKDTINYDIKITEGQQATIGNVNIAGNDKTHEHVIRREIRTLPGEKFSRANLIRSQREIASLGYFDAEKIGITPKPKPDGTVDIDYTVVEKSSDQLELQAGLGGALGLTGTLGIAFNNFSLKNIFNGKAYDPLPMGDGQKLSIRGQANGKWYNSFNFSFTEPWLGGKKPNSLQLTAYRTFFSQERYGSTGHAKDSAMTTYGLGANIIKRLKWPDDNFVLTYGLNYQLYHMVNYTSLASTLFSNGNANNLFLKLALSRYSVDQPTFPRSGSNISLVGSFTLPYSLLRSKDISNESANQKYKWIEYHKYRFTAEWYQRIKGNLILKLAAKQGYVASYTQGIMSPFERFQLGGNGMTGYQIFGKDIIAQRGYDVYQSSAIIFNKYTAEVRYPFSLNPSSTIYGLAFFDAANAWNSYKDFTPFKLNRDAGLGVRIFLPMFGMLGLDYGMRFDSTPANVVTPSTKFGQRTNFTFMLGVEPD